MSALKLAIYTLDRAKPALSSAATETIAMRENLAVTTPENAEPGADLRDKSK
jgi:hypothetical protein